MVVTGRHAHRISRDEAATCLLGCACAYDVAAIELLHHRASSPQWKSAKGLSGFRAFGPANYTNFDLETASRRTQPRFQPWSSTDDDKQRRFGVVRGHERP